LGANDYVTKPANVGSVAAAIERVREELVPKIKTFCRHLSPPAAAPAALLPPRPAVRLAAPRAATSRVELLAIGASTGGPNALAAVLPALPADFPAPIVIVQHMPPVFTRSMADRLNAQSAIGVSEAAPGEKLQAGRAYVAPGDFHMTLVRDAGGAKVRLHQGPPENSCRPAVDVLFRSAAETYRDHVLAVVLTGMGKDGLNGCQTIRDGGGQILAQDEATSVVWGMPGFVARSGLADQVLPLERMAAEIVRRVRQGRSAPLAV
jgi:two-component system chemotaxis response regulator CheB